MTSNQEDGSKKELPAGYVLRALEVGDYNKGFMELLSNLTTVGNVSMDMFLERYNRMKETTLYHPFVIVDLHTAKVVATACLVLEYHFIHECGKRGRVEDVVVATNMRGKSFGSLLTQHLVDLAKELGVYKLSLECFDNLITFYEKAGFRRDGNSFMVQRFD